MPLIKLFTVNPKTGKKSSLAEENINTYYFSVLWSRNASCNLYLLNGKMAGGTWHQIITQMIVDTDGEITVELGKFAKGTKISLFVGVQAITDLKKVRFVITNITTNESAIIFPATPGEEKNLGKDEPPINTQINNYELL